MCGYLNRTTPCLFAGLFTLTTCGILLHIGEAYAWQNGFTHSCCFNRDIGS